MMVQQAGVLSLTVTSAASSRLSWSRFRVSAIFLWRHGYLPNLTVPRCFNEWVQWRKLNDRDQTLAALTSKVFAKSLASDRIGPEHIVPTLWQGMQLPSSPPWTMPFVVKSNHGCKQFVVVRSDWDWQRAQRLAPAWLKRAYGKWLDEWHYDYAERHLLVEPFIGSTGSLPHDYKVFVFGGVAQLIQVHLERDVNHRWVQYDRNWLKMSNSPDDVEAPLRLPEMLEAAEQIGAGWDHLRVDFYEVEGRLWFGETCLFPGSGLDPFDPPELDQILGRFWDASSGIARSTVGLAVASN